MRLAIQEAQKGAGFVAPNPLVGCVILSAKGELLSVGHHARVGQDHAEVQALEAIRDPGLLKDAQVYVTLEPCAHQGRTPPCAPRLARLPIDKVVYGMMDPNPKVAGKGLEILKAAGKKVETLPELYGELEDLAEVFLFNQEQGRAFTAIKVATTLDGQMAEANGHSQWITGETAREHAHFLRGCYDALVVGRGTFQADNPSLNIRHPRFAAKTNKVLVLDPQAKALPALMGSKLMQCHAPDHIIWVTAMDATAPAGVQIWQVKHDKISGFDWQELTMRAYQNGIHSLFVEGGAVTIGQLLNGKSAQRWYQFLAPDLFGARQGLSVGAAWGHSNLDQRIRLLRPSWRGFGRDLLVSGRLF